MTNQHPLHEKHLPYVALVALVLGLMFVAPFIGIVAVAALMAFLFHGVYEKLNKKLKPPIAATLTLVTSILVVVIPVTIVLIFTALQLTHLAGDMSVYFSSGRFLEEWNISEIVNKINSFATSAFGTGDVVSASSILNTLRDTLPGLLKGVASFMTTVIGGIPMTIVLTIMYVILFYEFLVYGKTIKQTTISLSPFKPDITRLYLTRMGLMANAMAKGQLFISVVISLLSAILLSLLLGLGDYFFLMTVVFTLLNLVPLGCGVIVIPITLIAMVSGMFWPGLIALGLYILISNLDAVIRPRIIPRSITLTPALTMLSAFAGISTFGILGLIYGPILMIVIVTSIQIYLENYKKA